MRSYRIICFSPRHQIWSDDGVAYYFKFETNTLFRYRLVIFNSCILSSLFPSRCLSTLLLLDNHLSHWSFVFFFRLFPSGVATADFPSPVISSFCIILRHFNLSHILFHHIHKPPVWPSSFPLSWQLNPQHHSPNIPIIFPP